MAFRRKGVSVSLEDFVAHECPGSTPGCSDKHLTNLVNFFKGCVQSAPEKVAVGTLIRNTDVFHHRTLKRKANTDVVLISNKIEYGKSDGSDTFLFRCKLDRVTPEHAKVQAILKHAFGKVETAM